MLSQEDELVSFGIERKWKKLTKYLLISTKRNNKNHSISVILANEHEGDIGSRSTFRNEIRKFKGIQGKKNNRFGRIFNRDQRQQLSARMRSTGNTGT